MLFPRLNMKFPLSKLGIETNSIEETTVPNVRYLGKNFIFNQCILCQKISLTPGIGSKDPTV